MKVTKSQNGFVVDATDLGPLLGLEPKDVPDLMKRGLITSQSEHGTEEDEGRFRLTFWYETVRVRLTCDAEGEVIKRSRVDTGR